MKSIAKFALVLSILLLPGAVSAQQSDRDTGLVLYREGKFTEAIELLERRVATHENDRTAWIFLGGAYVHSGNKEKASDAFAKTNVRTTDVPRYDKSIKITHKPQPRYTREARRNMTSGTIRVAVEFRSDGTIGFAFPLQTINLDLIRPAVEAAEGIQFEPAMKDGKPVTVINLVEYGFWIG